MRVYSIKRRITGWFAALSSLVLLAFGGYLYRSLDAHFMEQDTEELASRVTLVRWVLSELRSEADIGASNDRFQNTLAGDPRLHLQILSPDGRALFASRRYQIPEEAWGDTVDAHTTPTLTRTWYPAPDILYRVVNAWGQIGESPREQVRIILALDVTEHHAALRQHRRSLIVAFVAGLAASTFLGWWIARREIDSVQRMASTAQRVSASQLGERLDAEGTPVELRELLQAFNSMLDRLEQSFARLSDFSSDLAHELRTPIHNLMMQCQVVLNKTRSESDYRRVLEANIEELERIARMVEDMLFLAKADQAQAVPKKEPFELREQVDKVSAYFEPLLDDRGLRLSCEGNATVQADRVLVERVISNLLSNAMRHSAPESTIHISIGRADYRVRLEVTNEGAGIPIELQERVFDRFFQLSASRSRNDAGSGLGLAIVKSIMDLHHGSVGVTSRPDGPTTFTVWLPA